MKLKVYGGLSGYAQHPQLRTFVATTSKKKVAELTGHKLRYIQTSWTITGNQREVEIALAAPRQVFVYAAPRSRSDTPIVPVEELEAAYNQHIESETKR